MSNMVKVLRLPDCQIPLCSEIAHYDAQTKQGPWGYLCDSHFRTLGVGLGTGKGQRLILENEDTEAKLKEADMPDAQRYEILFRFVVDSPFKPEQVQAGNLRVLEEFTPKNKKTKVISKETGFHVIEGDVEFGRVSVDSMLPDYDSMPDPEPEPEPVKETKKQKKAREAAEAAAKAAESEDEDDEDADL